MARFEVWEEAAAEVANILGRGNVVLHGSIAMGIYGAARDSMDVDFIAACPVLGKSGIKAKMVAEGYAETQTMFVDDGLVRRFRKGSWRVDIFETDYLSFLVLKLRASSRIVRGVRMMVISIRDLIRRKRKRSSPQDVADIARLEWIGKLKVK